jgi:hypothetical protein
MDLGYRDSRLIGNEPGKQKKEFISVMHTFLACDDLLHRGNFTFQLVVRSESQTRGERHMNHPRVSILAFLSVAVAHLVGAV